MVWRAGRASWTDIRDAGSSEPDAPGNSAIFFHSDGPELTPYWAYQPAHVRLGVSSVRCPEPADRTLSDLHAARRRCPSFQGPLSSGCASVRALRQRLIVERSHWVCCAWRCDSPAGTVPCATQSDRSDLVGAPRLPAHDRPIY